MRTLLTSLTVLLIASCSSGSGGQPTPTAILTADVAITVDNALAAAQAGVRGSFDFLRLSYLGARFLQTPQPQPAGSQPTQPALAATVLSTEVLGPDGGVATFSWEDVNGYGAYSSDDVFTISFDDYEDGGMMLNGVMIIDDVRLQGLLPGDGTYVLDATLNLVGLRVHLGAMDTTFTIALPFRLENRIIIEIFELSLLEDHTFGRYEVQQGARLTRYENNEITYYLLDGGVHSPELEGIVRFSTPGFLRGSPFLDDPTEGVLVVSGANGSLLEIEPTCIVPGVCFGLDLRVDEDGDREFEGTLSSSWSALLPQ